MSKILVTNDAKWFEDLNRKFCSNFALAQARRCEQMYASVYQKLNLEAENYHLDGEDFIFTSGTFFYKEQFGKPALKELLRDAKEKSVTELRKNMLGSYAVMVKSGDTVRIFVDETHTYSFYYYLKDNKYILTNTFFHIAHCVREAIHAYAFLERGVRRCIMSNQSPFKNVYKLCAAEYFELNLKSGAFGIQKAELNDYSCDFRTKEEAIVCIVQRLKKIMALRSKYFKRYFHFLTGGIDSRLELALNLFQKDEVKLGYWMGRDVLTNGTTSDLKIVELVASRYGLPFECYDVGVNFSQALSSINVQSCMKYGEYASVYCGNRKWFEIFENMKQMDCVGFGYLGESLRNLTELDRNYKKPYKVADLVEGVYCRSGIEKHLVKLEGFYSFVTEEFLQLLNLKQEPAEGIEKQTAFKLFTYSRFEADCVMNNFVNLFCYSFPIFGQKMVADLIYSLDYEWLKNDGFSVSLIREFAGDLLEIPFYSHHKEFVYDQRSNAIRKTLKFTLLDGAKNLFCNTPIYTRLYLGYLHRFFRPQSAVNDEIMAIAKEYLLNIRYLDLSGMQILPAGDWKGVEIASWATFVADFKVMEMMNTGGTQCLN